MHCRNCGNEVLPQAMICTSCGAPPLKGNKFCQNCGSETNPLAEICLKCGVRLSKGSFPGAKSKLAAGLLGIFLGAFGVHRFYLGYIGIGVAQIIVTIITCGIGSVWGLIEGILILTGNINKDAMGRDLAD
jgi:hypothetical protein